MNQSEQCHQISNCEGLYVDGFAAFKAKTQDRRCSFILSHYHADHYTGLPKNNAYKGPALIHCTPVTGALLREVHGVSTNFIVEHPYGITWTHEYCKANQFLNPNAVSYPTVVTEITFYDANHCPGAAIILTRLPASDGVCHLHTGDMRYHEKFLEYPLLKDAVLHRKIDRVYLDTTYGHPKHNFPPQQSSINLIASKVKEFLKPIIPEICTDPTSVQSVATVVSSDPSLGEYKTLVLLSCYSIGKEKVLWAAATQSNQMIYVNDAKFKKLQCITGHKNIDISSGLLNLCTQDLTKSDLHVISMGTAGKMFPYFIPNFEGCAKYAKECNRDYTRVVAFIPTGWADSKYNKKHSVSKKDVTIFSEKQVSSVINVEIQLVAYSEHSSFRELRSFVEFLKPKRVIPTVFSNDNDAIAVEKRFKDVVDSYGAKVAFLNSMGQKRKSACSSQIMEEGKKKMAKACCAKTKQKLTEGNIDHSDHLELSSKKLGSSIVVDDSKIATLVSMGFDAPTCRKSLLKNFGDINRSIEWLLRNGDKSTHVSNKGSRTKSVTTITNFFSRKNT